MSEIKRKEKRAFRSLTFTLTLHFLVFCLVILVITSALQIYLNFKIEQKLISDQLQIIAQNSANIIRSSIEKKLSILEVAAKAGPKVDFNEMKQAAEKLIAEPDFRQVAVFDSTEQELIKFSRLSKFEVGCLKGEVVHEIFSEVRQGKKDISPVCIDSKTNEPMVILTVPITDVYGNFHGALMAEMKLKFMWELMDKMKIGKKGLAYVVTKQGDLIAFKDISRILKGENLIYLNEVAKFVKKLPSEGEAEISKGILGTKVLTTHVSLGTPDWAVVVELPITEAYQTVFYGTGLSIAILFFFALLAIATSIPLSRRITRPIISLRNAALEIGKGKLETKIEIQAEKEIEELAQTFNQMAADLKESYENLEEKVRERTKELREKMAELERFHRLAVGRELKMVELKEEIKRLKEELEKIKGRNKNNSHQK